MGSSWRRLNVVDDYRLKVIPAARPCGGARWPLLILDNPGAHHCKPVKAWLAGHQKHIEVFFLPSYSPEPNPDERLNADLKHAIGSKVPVRTKDKLRAAANDHMAMIGNKPERVKSHFQVPRVKYAA